MTDCDVGIVIPTLGTRPAFIKETICSIRNAGDAHICLVVPADIDLEELIGENAVEQVVTDPMSGLPSAINYGIESLPQNIHYVNWLGDDDCLTKDSIEITRAALLQNPETVMVFGSCSYIDERGISIWKNKSGPWAVGLLRFGPCLIPQPGALFRRDSYNQVGGLSTKYKCAFDFDLFLKLAVVGKLQFINKTVSEFRWHSDSLSVGQRVSSVREASTIRREHLPRMIRNISVIWEFPVRMVTLYAGKRVSRKATRYKS